jgi:hypothetical protein
VLNGAIAIETTRLPAWRSIHAAATRSPAPATEIRAVLLVMTGAAVPEVNGYAGPIVRFVSSDSSSNDPPPDVASVTAAAMKRPGAQPIPVVRVAPSPDGIRAVTKVRAS